MSNRVDAARIPLARIALSVLIGITTSGQLWPREANAQTATKASASAGNIKSSQPSTAGPGAAPPGYVNIDVGKCGMYISEQIMQSVPGKRAWDGKCLDGLAHGSGIFRVYSQSNKLLSVARVGVEKGVGKSYSEGYRAGLSGKIAYSGPKGKGSTEDFPPSQVPAWAREIIDGKPRASTQTAQTATAPNASATAGRPQASANVVSPANRNRLFVAYGKDLARPFVVTNESMLQAVLSDYLRILNASRVNILSVTDFRTEECIPRPGSGSLFAFVVYRHESQSGNSMAWGVVCDASSAEVAAKSAQRACEARSGRCNAPRAKASTFDSNSVQLIIGDLRVPGENKTMKEISVQLSESRDSGGRNVGDIVRWDFYSNISSGFICDWFNGAWSNGSPDLMIYGNGPFFKNQATRSREGEIAYRCSNFL